MRKRVMLLIMIIILSSAAITTYIIKNENDKKQIEKQLSNKILIGVEQHGGYGPEEAWLDHETRVYKNKKVEFLVDGKVISEATLSQEQYDKIADGINLKSLYYTKCRSEEGVMDGYSRTVILYGRDNLPKKKVGCYMPTNKNINDTFELVHDNVPRSIYR